MIISTQSLSRSQLPGLPQPIGKIYYLDFQYNRDKIYQPTGRQIFSDIDPYGEENWD